MRLPKQSRRRGSKQRSVHIGRQRSRYERRQRRSRQDKKLKQRSDEARDRARAKLQKTMDHSRAGAVKPVAARNKVVLAEQA